MLLDDRSDSKVAEWIVGVTLGTRLRVNVSERDLELAVRSRPAPAHLAFIPDGNRRYAIGADVSQEMAYRAGYRKVEEVLGWCGDFSIQSVTIWALSVANLTRPEDEVRTLIDLIEGWVTQLVELQRRVQVPRHIRWLGQPELFSESMRETFARAEDDTACFGPSTLDIALGYDGRTEIVDAVKRRLVAAVEAGEDLESVSRHIGAADIERHLYRQCTAPDLIVRTSGELRLSGFLLWQASQAELFFSEPLWPDFKRVDFLRALSSFQQRDRRLGR